MSIASRVKSVVVPSANNDAEAAAAIDDRRAAEALIAKLNERGRELLDQQSALRRSIGAEAIEASEAGDGEGLTKLEGKLSKIETQIEVNKLALAEAGQRVYDADSRLHKAKSAERLRDMRTKTNRFSKRGVALQEAVKVLHEARLAALETGFQINTVLNGTGMRLADSGTSARQIDDMIAEELGRLHALSADTFYGPAPGASVKSYYGISPAQRKSLTEEIEQRCEYLLRRIAEGPNPPKTVVVRPPDTAAPQQAQAANLLPVEAQNLNGTSMSPDVPGVSLEVAMAINGGIRKETLTFGGPDPAAEVEGQPND